MDYASEINIKYIQYNTETFQRVCLLDKYTLASIMIRFT